MFWVIVILKDLSHPILMVHGHLLAPNMIKLSCTLSSKTPPKNTVSISVLFCGDIIQWEFIFLHSQKVELMLGRKNFILWTGLFYTQEVEIRNICHMGTQSISARQNSGCVVGDQILISLLCLWFVWISWLKICSKFTQCVVPGLIQHIFKFNTCCI